jgi:hypothetical protein
MVITMNQKQAGLRGVRLIQTFIVGRSGSHDWTLTAQLFVVHVEESRIVCSMARLMDGCHIIEGACDLFGIGAALSPHAPFPPFCRDGTRGIAFSWSPAA